MYMAMVVVYMAMVVSMRKSNMTWSSALVIPAGPKIDVVMAERSVWLVPILSLRYSSMFCLRCLLQLSADDCGKLARIACFIAISWVVTVSLEVALIDAKRS